MLRYKPVSFFLCFLFFTPTVFAQTSTVSSGFGLGFGGALAVGNGEILVGSAPMGWPRGEEPAGMLYIYQKNDQGEWVESGTVKASDGELGDNFGRSLDLDGSMLVVGAPGVGAAYAFSRSDAGAWMQVGKLVPSSMEEGAEFAGINGRTTRTRVLAVAGDRIAVSAFKSGQRPGSGLGQVHVFHNDGTSWTEEAVLKADTTSDSSGFGWAVAAESGRIFVSAPAADEGAGAVYVFSSDASGAWRQEARLHGDNLGSRSSLGLDLVVHSGRIYAGAPFYNRTGAVLVFEKDDSAEAWMEVQRLSSFVSSPRSRGGMGSLLAVSDETLLVSGGDGVFALQSNGDGEWGSLHRLQPADDRESRGYGRGLAVDDGVSVIGSPLADYEEGIATIYERSEPMGRWIAASTLASEVTHLESITGNQVDCEDGSAEMFACDKVDLISFLSSEELTSERGVKMTDIWGWEDPESGNEYVLAARTNGVAFVDISNPYNPVYIGQLMKTETSPGSTWRDVKVYKDHAFIVADGAADHGMQVFDLTRLRDVPPEEMPKTFDADARYTGIHSTHNIVINEETGFAYAVGNRAGGETCDGQLHMIDIRDPRNPEFAGCFSHPNAGGTHDSQCVVYQGPDDDYAGKEVCLNSNGSSFIIADVSDKANPKTLAHVTYPNLAYTHQGWLTEDHRYFYMNDELDELNGNVGQTRTLIWDVQDLEDPLLVNEFMLDSKASDHNLYVKGNFMYQSNYQAGLRILDITDPVNPVEAAHFDTVPWGEDQPGFGGSWSNYPYFKSGIIAVSSRGEGLFLVKKRDVDI